MVLPHGSRPGLARSCSPPYTFRQRLPDGSLIQTLRFRESQLPKPRPNTSSLLPITFELHPSAGYRPAGGPNHAAYCKPKPSSRSKIAHLPSVTAERPSATNKSPRPFGRSIGRIPGHSIKPPKPFERPQKRSILRPNVGKNKFETSPFGSRAGTQRIEKTTAGDTLEKASNAPRRNGRSDHGTRSGTPQRGSRVQVTPVSPTSDSALMQSIPLVKR